MRHTADYREYLRSPEWKQKRQQVIARAGNSCEQCGRASLNLEVHHLHYESLFDEDLDDLEALCKTCHIAADSDRRYDTALETWARKAYGFRWPDIPDWAIEEFDEWLEEQEGGY